MYKPFRRKTPTVNVSNYSVAVLRDSVSRLRGSVDELNSSVNGLNDSVDHLNRGVNDLNGSVSDLNGSVNDLRGPGSDLHGPVRLFTQNLKSQRSLGANDLSINTAIDIASADDNTNFRDLKAFSVL